MKEEEKYVLITLADTLRGLGNLVLNFRYDYSFINDACAIGNPQNVPLSVSTLLCHLRVKSELVRRIFSLPRKWWDFLSASCMDRIKMLTYLEFLT